MNKNILPLFHLRENMTFLNFGSFGACPREVLEAQMQWQQRVESNPVQFFKFDAVTLLAQARKALADYVHCDVKDLVYVSNPSYAVNIVAKSIHLQAGDEVLTTNLEYGACDKTWQFYCDKVGATYVKQDIALPVTTTEQFVEDFFKGISVKTKLVFISHITSATALKLPVEEIVAKANALGLLTFVDGAHVPGNTPLNIENLNADFYTGACHKWMMTPKGSSFFYAKKDKQNLLEPLVVSWGYKSEMQSDSLFLDHHQMQGTRDITPFLCIPEAIAFRIKQDWDNLSKQANQIAMQQAPKFYSLLGTQPLSPLNEKWIAQMISIPIRTRFPMQLEVHLANEYDLFIPIMPHSGSVYMRYSMTPFNNTQDLERLYQALVETIQNTDLIEV